ncbi:hypothetical protein HMPREF9554_01331 [Treponema phagedenis F0421]|nr:hypothetical protein HMPREF9554_01331 [Treponema phagedenis F0421]
MGKLTIGRSFENFCTFANEFKSFNFTVLCDALKHRLELSNGEQTYHRAKR